MILLCMNKDFNFVCLHLFEFLILQGLVLSVTKWKKLRVSDPAHSFGDRVFVYLVNYRHLLCVLGHTGGCQNTLAHFSCSFLSLRKWQEQ